MRLSSLSILQKDALQVMSQHYQLIIWQSAPELPLTVSASPSNWRQAFGSSPKAGKSWSTIREVKLFSLVRSISTLLSPISRSTECFLQRRVQTIEWYKVLTDSSVLADELPKDDWYGFMKRIWSSLPLWRKQHSSEQCCLNKPPGFLGRKCWSRNQASVFEYHFC